MKGNTIKTVPRLILMERDKQIIQYISEFKVANAIDIQKLWWKDSNSNACTKRLQKLCQYGYLKAYRQYVQQPYLYYKNRLPINLKHDLFVQKAYVKYATDIDINIVKYKKEYAIDKNRCDLYLLIRNKQGQLKDILIEVQINHMAYENKYDYLFIGNKWNQYFNSRPIVVVFSNRQPKTSYPTDLVWHKLDIL